MRPLSTRAGRWQGFGRIGVAAGLVWSGGQAWRHGGALNVVLAGAQLAVAVLLVVKGDRIAALALAALLLVPGAIGPVRAWTAASPVACTCARSSHATPGLFSLTGVGFAAHVALIIYAVSLARRKDAANRE
jgi:hypothetical protein